MALDTLPSMNSWQEVLRHELWRAVPQTDGSPAFELSYAYAEACVKRLINMGVLIVADSFGDVSERL